MSDVTTNGSTSSGSVSSPSSSPSSSCDEESVAEKTIDAPYSSRVEVLKCITGSFDPSPRIAEKSSSPCSNSVPNVV